MFVEELTWKQFSTLSAISKLPINEQVRRYNLYLNEIIEARMNYIHHQTQVLGGSGKKVVTEDSVPAGCIEFVVNTIEGTYFEVSFRSNTDDFTYTVNWGDGETGEGSSGEGYVLLDHTYPDGVADYTVRVCFSDASIIHDINFPGFD